MGPEHVTRQVDPEGREARTLLDHTKDAVEAAEALFGDMAKQTRLGGRWLSFFKLDPTKDWGPFRDALLAACLFHDWGKANADMQAVLGRTGADLRRTGLDIRQWVAGQFGEPDDHGPLSDEPFVQEIIRKRAEDLTARGKWERWGEFRTACDTLDARALLPAPCGSGKTLAAWRWIAARASNPERPVKRVLFLYPTRATATEGFKD